MNPTECTPCVIQFYIESDCRTVRETQKLDWKPEDLFTGKKL